MTFGSAGKRVCALQRAGKSETPISRPHLNAALDMCRRQKATLIIAKLDRLARSVAFVSALPESKVKFVAVDMPEADVTFMQMAAVFGDWEARRISERTKAALAKRRWDGLSRPVGTSSAPPPNLALHLIAPARSNSLRTCFLLL
jgi:DNA invertase Pin-like site-specific DNA recombinase